MKKLVWFACFLFVLTACEKEKKTPMIDVQLQQNDSLQKMLDQKNNEINDMMATFNEIQEGFRLISEAEGRVTIAKEGEGADRKAVIRKDMEFIQETMMQNRDRIESLRQKLRESTINGEELRKTIDGLVKQMQDQENTIKALREELNNKDFHISELDKAITELNDNVSDLNIRCSFMTVANHSVNQVFIRSINTTLTSLIPVIGMLLFQLIPNTLLSIFSADEEMYELGRQCLTTISWGFEFAAFTIVSGTLFQATAHGMNSLIITILRQIVILIPLAVILAKTLGTFGVWLAFPIGEGLSAIVCIFLVRNVYNKDIKKLDNN